MTMEAQFRTKISELTSGLTSALISSLEKLEEEWMAKGIQKHEIGAKVFQLVAVGMAEVMLNLTRRLKSEYEIVGDHQSLMKTWAESLRPALGALLQEPYDPTHRLREGRE